jgi:hypothetical protein
VWLEVLASSRLIHHYEYQTAAACKNNQRSVLLWATTTDNMPQTMLKRVHNKVMARVAALQREPASKHCSYKLTAPLQQCQAGNSTAVAAPILKHRRQRPKPQLFLFKSDTGRLPYICYAGKGVALALGDAGATVYVTGRSSRLAPAPHSASPAPGKLDCYSIVLCCTSTACA